jgi:PAS domain S-box-containing protein
VGRSFTLFYPEEALAADLPGHALQVAAREGRFENEGWRIRKDGSRFWARVVITALYDAAGALIGFTKVTSDLTARRQAEDALRSSEQQFRLLVQSVKDYAILMLDPEGRVVSWNEGAQRIKGYTAEEIVGRSFEVFYPAKALASGFPAHELETAARDGRFEDENWRIRKDGSRFWANVVITALRDSHGQLIGFSKMTRDLTGRRKTEQQARALAAEQAAHAEALKRNQELLDLNSRLQAALSEAENARKAMEEAYRELDQFAYVASHDLKAPLRGIANLAQWIQEDTGERLTDDSVQHMRLLQVRVNRMQSLIDGILAYSRAGRVFAQPERVDTGRMVREVLDLQAIGNEAKVHVAPHMPKLLAEPVPLQQVFMNLIGNAVKYASAVREDFEIRVAWREVDDGIEFSVTDNGPGITPEFHDRIWGLFQTLEARDKVEGTGIGLALVKKVVESRGGRVGVQSTPGQGARFTFVWPQTQAGNLP